MKKFDHIITNPPYSGNLHLKILKEAISHSKRVICLHPVYYDCLHDKIKDYSLKMQMASYLTEAPIIIKRNEANDIFNIRIYKDLLIGVYDINGGYKVERTKESLLWEKMTKYGIKIKDFYHRKETLYRLPLVTIYLNSNIVRHSPFLKEDGLIAKSGWTKAYGDKWVWAYFESKNEMTNFKNMFSDTFMGKWLSHLELGRQITNITVPSDYTYPWTDEMLYDFFNLSREDIKIIEEEICSIKS